MSKVFIEESTLTDIGDALRRKHGETKTETVIEDVEVPATVISKTPNATGFDTHEGDAPQESFFDIVKFEGASKILVKIGWQAYGFSTILQIGEGEASDSVSFKKLPNIKKYSGDVTTTSKYNYAEVTFNSNTITFYYSGINNSTYIDLGYYAECISLDADNNPLGSQIIQVEKEVELPNKYNPKDMPKAIDDVKGKIEPLDIVNNGTYNAPVGIDGYNPITVNVPQESAPPEEAFVITGNCAYRFANDGWTWFLEKYGNSITTQKLADTNHMFFTSRALENIPFDFHCDNSATRQATYMFGNCNKLESIGKIIDFYPSAMSSLFESCYMLKEIPEFVNPNWSRIQTYNYANISGLFSCCYSLRSIPESLLKEFYGVMSTPSYAFFMNAFKDCYALKEIRGLNPQTGTITSNMFGAATTGTFAYLYMANNIIFATQDDGAPYSVNWKTQTIDLRNVGWTHSSDRLLNYNSGITRDTEVTDDASYQANKDNPDWWSWKQGYCKYNHDSAVNTINSLPDTSAYLATAGGTNTIKFLTGGGSATDGGAQDALTAEEIAQATVKGWTVSFTTI